MDQLNPQCVLSTHFNSIGFRVQTVTKKKRQLPCLSYLLKCENMSTHDKKGGFEVQHKYMSSTVIVVVLCLRQIKPVIAGATYDLEGANLIQVWHLSTELYSQLRC